jgi:hypothetical protein
LKALGIKLDTTQKSARHNLDSLMKIVSSQKQQLDLKVANLDVCTSGDNLRIKKTEKGYGANVDMCCTVLPVHDVRIKYGMVKRKNGQLTIGKEDKSNNEMSWLLNFNNKMNANTRIGSEINLIYEYQPTDSLYLIITGTYKDDYNKQYYLQRILVAENNNFFSIGNDDWVADVTALLKKNHLWR